MVAAVGRKPICRHSAVPSALGLSNSSHSTLPLTPAGSSNPCNIITSVAWPVDRVLLRQRADSRPCENSPRQSQPLANSPESSLESVNGYLRNATSTPRRCKNPALGADFPSHTGFGDAILRHAFEKAASNVRLSLAEALSAPVYRHLSER